MSYQVLARKWRPNTFKDMVGQEHVLQALIHALDNQRLHHAYLFTGTRGVGKTTIGRLLARCLNCETGVTSNPCGTCTSCQEIQEGRFVDLIEIDAASRTGVDDMRELTDNVQYAPTRGRFKVYLIDEVHMLSNQSFNAFLKTLEEPPEHVKFLLATTDPQKLPVTVLSRCLQFNLKRMTPEHIAGHLRHVLTQEEIPFEEPALWLLARAADGSMRDALSLTDQAIAFGNQTLNSSDVSNMLGTIDQGDIARLVDALVAEDGPALLSEIQRISDFAPDYSIILADLLSLFHRVTMEQVVPGSADNSLGDAAMVQTLARQVSAEDAQLFYQAALMGRKDLAVTPDARMGFEMTLLRMLAFRPGADRREPPAGGGARTASEGGSRDEPEPAAQQQPQPEPEPAESVPAPEPEPEPKSEPEPEPAPEPEPQPEPPSQEEPPPWEPESELPWEPDEPTVSDETATAPVQLEPSAKLEPSEKLEPSADIEPSANEEPSDFHWERDFRSLNIVGMPGNLASNAAMIRSGNDIELVLDEGHARLLNARHEEKILEALRNRFGDAINVKITEGETRGKTPAAWEENRRQERQAAAEAAIHDDPLVKSIVERFDARVVEGSIRPGKQT
ncbi:DNA polymerase III subunit gamma/tau [Marinobacter confluentis]|uniref:DNA polymerase III subunit gamma/tau n=1 Tax=Marinobacter confluentis TaxID=1697557 RepID=A0A4Z1BVZ3_9GAMM|nr:DNA polymerase III subunit gamma/tau [Marinobacter confluentis]TGN41539.1 DNA polymerase III subunit gamma/tau [Marinobacter confluentis]